MTVQLAELVDLYECATRRGEAREPLDGLVVPDSNLAGRRFLPRLDIFEVLAFESDDDWACMILRAPPPRREEDEEHFRYFRIINFARVDDQWLIREVSGSMVQAAYLEPGQDIEDGLKATAVRYAREEKPPPPRSATFVSPDARTKTPTPECGTPRFLSALVVRVEDIADEEDLRDAANELGCELPSCYREYVLSYGGAEYSSVLQVVPPWDLGAYAFDDRYLESRRYWRWDDNEHLDPQAASECIQIGTLEIADVVYHPADPAVLYALPKQSRTIHRVGPTLDDALEWLCGSDVLVPAFDVRYVFGCAEYVERGWADSEDELEIATVVEQLSKLGLHEAEHQKNWPGETTVLLLCPIIHGIVEVSRRAKHSRRAPVVTISFDHKNAPMEPRRELAAKLEKIGYRLRGGLTR